MRIGERDVVRLSIVAVAFLLIAFETPSGFAQKDATSHVDAAADRRRDNPPSNPPEVILAEPQVADPSRLLDEIVTVKVNGVLLNVPWGYLQGWPLQQPRRQVIEWKEMGFTFWMPDRRYTRFNPNSYPGAYRPPEPGRSEPGPDAYVVGVSNLRRSKLDDPGYVSPEQAFRNSTSSPPSVGSYFFQDEPFGLVRYGVQDWPYISPALSTEYRHKEGTDPQVLMRCRLPDQSPSTSTLWCRARVHFVADDLAFNVAFPREKLSRWRDVVLAVRDLYGAWKSSP
jgi:hypothetical protein